MGMTKAQRDELVTYIDQKAGPVPSNISNALADLEPFVQSDAKAKAAFQTILTENLKIGTSPGDEEKKPGMLVWLRQKLMALPVEDDTPEPVPGGGSAGEFPAEFPPNGVLPWVLTNPNTAACVKLPASTSGLGVSMVVGGGARSPMYVVTAASPIRDIAQIKARVTEGHGISGNGSTSRIKFTPGHYMSCYFEPMGEDARPQLMRGDAF